MGPVKDGNTKPNNKESTPSSSVAAAESKTAGKGLNPSTPGGAQAQQNQHRLRPRFAPELDGLHCFESIVPCWWWWIQFVYHHHIIITTNHMQLDSIYFLYCIVSSIVQKLSYVLVWVQINKLCSPITWFCFFFVANYHIFVILCFRSGKQSRSIIELSKLQQPIMQTNQRVSLTAVKLLSLPDMKREIIETLEWRHGSIPTSYVSLWRTRSCQKKKSPF